MLGKKAAKGHIASSRAPNKTNGGSQQAAFQAINNSASSRSAQVNAADDDDDEEGRASMVASGSARKRNRVAVTKPKPSSTQSAPTQLANLDAQSEAGHESIQTNREHSRTETSDEDRRPTKKHAVSYLDQLLAEKANRKKKKKKQQASPRD